MRRRALIAAAMILSSPILLDAQEASPPAAIQGTATDPTRDVLPAGTEVHLRMVDTVASNTHKQGDRFSMEVADPVVVNGHEWIPAGAPAVGEVIDAAKRGMGGNPGRLILAARFVIVNEVRIDLRSFTAGAGQGRQNSALTVGIVVGLPGLFVVGKHMVMPKGTDVFAKIATDHVADINR